MNWKRFNPFGPDNQKPVFCTHHVYDYGTSKVVGRDQEHIKLELVDNKSNKCDERHRLRTKFAREIYQNQAII